MPTPFRRPQNHGGRTISKWYTAVVTSLAIFLLLVAIGTKTVHSTLATSVVTWPEPKNVPSNQLTIAMPSVSELHETAKSVIQNLDEWRTNRHAQNQNDAGTAEHIPDEHWNVLKQGLRYTATADHGQGTVTLTVQASAPREELSRAAVDYIAREIAAKLQNRSDSSLRQSYLQAKENVRESGDKLLQSKRELDEFLTERFPIGSEPDATLNLNEPNVSQKPSSAENSGRIRLASTNVGLPDPAAELENLGDEDNLLSQRATLRRELLQLLNERSRMLLRVTRQHPAVIELNSEISLINEQLKALPEPIEKIEQVDKPQEENNDAISVVSPRSPEQHQTVDRREELRRNREMAEKYRELKQAYESAGEIYRIRLDEERQAWQRLFLNSSAQIQVTTAEAPAEAIRADFGVWRGVFAAIFAAVVGAALALTSAANEDTLHTVAQAKALLAIPVVGAIPAAAFPTTHVSARRRSSLTERLIVRGCEVFLFGCSAVVLIAGTMNGEVRQLLLNKPLVGFKLALEHAVRWLGT